MSATKNKTSINKLTGIVVSVASLRTEDSCGVGEFLDLIPFANFCKSCGLELIQILPVNDTGTGSSPYSALSAFALHPIYISLKALPELSSETEENKKILAKIAKLQKSTDKEKLLRGGFFFFLL